MSKSFLRISALLSFLLAALTSAVLLPIYRIIGKDYVLSASLAYDLVDLLWQWFEIFLLALIAALLIVGVHHAGKVGAKPLYFICGGALVFKYLAAIASSAIVAGSLDLTVNYGTTAFSFLLEALMCVLVVFLTHRITATRVEAMTARTKAAKRLKRQLDAEAPLLPFTKPFCRKNPLQNVSYLAVGIITFFRLVSFVASEIAFSMMGYKFSWSDLPITLLYAFLTVLLPALIAYFGVYFLIGKLHNKYFAA